MVVGVDAVGGDAVGASQAPAGGVPCGDAPFRHARHLPSRDRSRHGPGPREEHPRDEEGEQGEEREAGAPGGSGQGTRIAKTSVPHASPPRSDERRRPPASSWQVRKGTISAMLTKSMGSYASRMACTLLIGPLLHEIPVRERHDAESARRGPAPSRPPSPRVGLCWWAWPRRRHRERPRAVRWRGGHKWGGGRRCGKRRPPPPWEGSASPWAPSGSAHAGVSSRP